MNPNGKTVGTVSPIITKDDYVVDGHHTLKAAEKNFGSEHVIEFEVQGKTFRDAFFLATGRTLHTVNAGLTRKSDWR